MMAQVSTLLIERFILRLLTSTWHPSKDAAAESPVHSASTTDKNPKGEPLLDGCAPNLRSDSPAWTHRSFPWLVSLFRVSVFFPIPAHLGGRPQWVPELQIEPPIFNFLTKMEDIVYLSLKACYPLPPALDGVKAH